MVVKNRLHHLFSAGLTGLLCVIVFTLPANAQGNFAGEWQVMRADDAPWLGGRPELRPDYPPYMRHARFVFHADRLIAPRWIACRKPRYETMSLPFEALFEGSLSDPRSGVNNVGEAARQLGFTHEPVESLIAGCSGLLFHLTDKDTALFALNNVVYTLRRRR